MVKRQIKHIVLLLYILVEELKITLLLQFTLIRNVYNVRTLPQCYMYNSFDNLYLSNYLVTFMLVWIVGVITITRYFLLQLLSPLPDISVVKSLQLLGWSAACGDISLAQDAATIHQYFLKVALR